MEHLAAAGRRAVFALRRRCADLKINDPAIVCQLFDALVKPVISYGCELWVNESATESLEILHRSFLKSLLGVNGTTPTQNCIVRVWSISPGAYFGSNKH